jgi:hypothetical protein
MKNKNISKKKDNAREYLGIIKEKVQNLILFLIIVDSFAITKYKVFLNFIDYKSNIILLDDLTKNNNYFLTHLPIAVN